MRCVVTISDPDRKLDFFLAVDCTYRGEVRSRCGWRDGGEKGEQPAIEIERARCLEIVVWCGKSGVSATPGLGPDDRLESHLGAWCLQHYGDEIESAVWEHVKRRDLDYCTAGHCNARNRAPKSPPVRATA